ncbi:Uncharacterised protein [Sphingobacterium spiritivorum]|uniref:DUF4876 domain-containing protein n=1 Tax=Sphingobacterium spiritivorum TaxID=258 RepID=A0A380CSG2_SPHSI|nr:DUF4876 domain-containing protein [Sphingobacterium spiritivorum]SUJ26700.1 Uncharacterised protein [Sphingobacterium spiritivorum]
MKKYIQHIYLLTLILTGICFTFAGCQKDIAPDLKATTLAVRVQYESAYQRPQLSTEGYTVYLKNLTTGAEDSARVEADGIALIPELSSGKYDIQVVKNFSTTEYEQVFGEKSKRDVTFNAAENGYKILPTRDRNEISLTLHKSVPGDWVIKQLYYAGSDLYKAASLRDNFFEIYNNSDEVLYADSLCMMFVYGRLSTTYRMPEKLLENGQFDWRQALGTEVAPANANTDYLYAQAIYMFPGNGTTYPVQPGQGLVVARSAINHKAPFTNKNGKVYEVSRPDLTVDLSKADFEVITTPYLEEGVSESLIDIPTPGKTSLIVIQRFGATMMMDNIGRIGYALFKTSEDIRKWPKYAEVKETTIEGKTLYTRVPKKYIIDAVETQPNTADRRIPKKLSPELDAGFGFVPLGSYSSQALMRKVARIVDGRRVLQDTNNSSNDFEWIMPAIPGGFKD